MACCEYVAKRRRESRARFSNNFATKCVRILVFLAMRPDTAGHHMHDAPHMFMHAAGGGVESHHTRTIIAIALDPIAMAHAVGGSSAMQGYFSSCMDAVPALLESRCYLRGY